MQNLMRNSILLTTAFLLLAAPMASAQSVGLDLSAAGHVDASGAMAAAGGAQATASGLVDEAKATAEGAVADAEARVDGLKADLQAEAQAQAAEADNFAAQAKAALGGALDAIKGFAASISVSIDAVFG